MISLLYKLRSKINLKNWSFIHLTLFMHALAFVVPARKLKPFAHLPIVFTGPELLSIVSHATISNHFTHSRNQDNKLLCKST